MLQHSHQQSPASLSFTQLLLIPSPSVCYATVFLGLQSSRRQRDISADPSVSEGREVPVIRGDFHSLTLPGTDSFTDQTGIHIAFQAAQLRVWTSLPCEGHPPAPAQKASWSAVVPLQEPEQEEMEEGCVPWGLSSGGLILAHC